MATATTNGSATSTGEQVQAWMEMFRDGWANPTDADSFCEHFVPWLHDDVRLIQASVPTLVGHEAFRERFARPLFELVPDLHGTVENWAHSGDTIYVELRLEGTIGGRPFTLRDCDRITLRDGKAAERIAYLDPAPLLKAVALSPRSWPKFLRTQLRNLRRAS